MEVETWGSAFALTLVSIYEVYEVGRSCMMEEMTDDCFSMACISVYCTWEKKICTSINTFCLKQNNIASPECTRLVSARKVVSQRKKTRKRTQSP
jgi:hypothetical protein